MRWRNRYGLLLLSLLASLTVGSSSSLYAEPWRVPLEAGELHNPTPPTQESIGRGAVVFALRCAVCHGEQGRGNGASSLSLGIPPTDLTTDNVQRQPDGVLFWKITVGRGPMPNWDLILTDEDRWHVINYLRAITKK